MSALNEAEKRRQKLLTQTQLLYRDSYDSPAVHPRYQASYRVLYGDDTTARSGGTFGIRLVLSLLIFAAFVMMDSRNNEIMRVNSTKIIQIISEDTPAFQILEHR